MNTKSKKAPESERNLFCLRVVELVDEVYAALSVNQLVLIKVALGLL